MGADKVTEPVDDCSTPYSALGRYENSPIASLVEWHSNNIVRGGQCR